MQINSLTDIGIENPNEDHLQAWEHLQEIEAVEDNLFDRLSDGGALLWGRFKEYPYHTAGMIASLKKNHTVILLPFGTVMDLSRLYRFTMDDPWSSFNPIPL